jgi:hypothetical protein
VLRRERAPGTLVTGLIGLAVAEVVVRSLVSLLRSILSGQPITPYVAPQFWLSYHHGFVRRGLPGQLLWWLSGGNGPSRAVVEVVGVTLSVAAALAVLTLAVLLARSTSSRLAGLAVAAVVLSSPLTVSLYLRDLGRVDAVGVVILALLVTLPWRRWPAALVVGGLAVLTSVAVATSELLVVFVVPVAVIAAVSALTRRPDLTDPPGPADRPRTTPSRALMWSAVAVLPCLLLAGLSAALPAPAATLAEATAAARAAGVPASVPLVPGLVDHDSVSRLRHGLLDNIRDYYATTTVARVLGTTLLWGGLFVGLIALVWLELGRSLRERVFSVVLVLLGSAAVALSVAAIDYRRWWALAAVTALALILQLSRSGRASPDGGRQHASLAPADRVGRAAGVGRIYTRRGSARIVLLVVIALAGSLLQSMPVWPLRLADLPLLGTLFG